MKRLLLYLRSEKTIIRGINIVCLSVLGALALVVALGTLMWPLLGDVTLIHYVVFLIDSGLKPYVQIKDINLPGSYLIDWAVIHFLGPGSLAERLYDYAVALAATASMVCLVPSKFRSAGLFAGLMLFLIHTRDGAVQTGQRDWSMTGLLLIAYCSYFHGLRANRRRYYVVAGVFLGLSAAIKPPALVFAIPLLIDLWVGDIRLVRRAVANIGLCSLGIMLPLICACLWLAHESALRTCMSTGISMMQYHAALQRLPLGALVSRGLTPLIGPAIIGMLLIPLVWQTVGGREFCLLGGASIAGFVGYVLQGKGYAYQRYPLSAFLLVVLGILFATTFRAERRLLRWVGLAGFCACCLIVAPRAASKALSYRPSEDQFGSELRKDLQTLGGDRLNGRIQCLDTFSGCLRVLYSMQLKQSTGSLYDEFLFGSSTSNVVKDNRGEFLSDVESRMPEVIILTPQDYSEDSKGYDRVGRWPEFERYLHHSYRLCFE